MNENSKNIKSETSTIFSENFSQNSKSAHFDMYGREKMSISVRQNRTIILENGIIKTVYHKPYTCETDCNKHTHHNVLYCDIGKHHGKMYYNICIEYYIK